MQPERIILLSPTHEQSLPTYHVVGPISEDFLKFLEKRNVPVQQPPQVLDKRGPGDHPIVEVLVESGTPVSELEALIPEFLATIDN